MHVFIDCQKAFNIVWLWHECVLLKLQRAGISDTIYELIQLMYHRSIFRMKCKNILSEVVSMTQGIHQGNVLSSVPDKYFC